MKTWRDKTCEKCIYRKYTKCMINPPTPLKFGYDLIANYPIVFVEAHTQIRYMMEPVQKPDYYTDACAKYKERTKR